MKAKTFENLIRKIVREEIDYALRREIRSLKEDLRDDLKPTITEHKERIVKAPKPPISENVKTSLKEKIMGKQAFKPLNYTNNNALNDLLNETAQGDTNLNRGTAPEMPVEAMPDPVQKVINRDYRELMKAIDKKKRR